MENHTQSRERGGGSSLITPTFLLGSGRFSRNLRWMGDVRDGDQGLFRVGLSYLQSRAERPVPLRLRPRTADGQTFPSLSALGIVVDWPCFIYVIRIFNGCN